jgi:hypothetical protein
MLPPIAENAASGSHVSSLPQRRIGLRRIGERIGARDP